MKTTCWHLTDGVLARQPLSEPRYVDPRGALPEQGLANLPVIVPVPGRDDAIAVVLVPATCELRTSVNGVSLSAGLTPLQDGDRLTVGEQLFWVSAECVAEETEYDPARHGRDVFCFMTKARLREGEPVTICPGRLGAPCGMIYKRAAWKALVEQPSGFCCPNCSFDPLAPPWKPSVPTSRKSLANLIHLLHQEAAR